MIKTMKYINLSDLAAALNIENETEFLFFWNTEDYNGRYILARKRELYIKSGDNYTMSTMLLFRKVI